MKASVLNSYLSSLQQEISVSVDKIKYKKVFEDSKDYALRGEVASYGYGGQLSERAYSLLKSDVSYHMMSYSGQQIDASYVSDSYDYVSRVNKPSTVLIDLMFSNNREFDFKV